MKKWIENSDNLSEYYGWYPIEKIANINLISYNFTDANLDKEEFFVYCLQQVKKDMIMSKELYIYLVAIEEVQNPNSKVERYKKCWRKISTNFDLEFLELSKEDEYYLNGMMYYAAIARTNIFNLHKVLKIIDAKKKYSMFISRMDYLQEIEENKIYVSDFVFLNSFDEIDKVKLIEICSKNHDLACCYGVDSLGAELAIIYNTHDRMNYFQ